MTKFLAELKQVKMKKQMLDNIYVMTVETDNPQVLELAALPSDTLFKVTIEAEKQDG